MLADRKKFIVFMWTTKSEKRTDFMHQQAAARKYRAYLQQEASPPAENKLLLVQCAHQLHI